MANEEMQNTMKFILDQQAQLTVKVDRLAEKVDGLAEKVDRIADAQIAHERRTARLEESFQLLVQLAGNMDGRMDTLTEAQSRTGEQLAETDKRLNSLIEVVERYISAGRDGHPEG